MVMMQPKSTVGARSIAGLVMLLCLARGSHSGGIDFDLNEPPPPEEEYLQEAEEEIQFQLVEQPLVCSKARGFVSNKLQQDRNSAASLRDRFEHVMKAHSRLSSTKELPDYCDYEKFKATHEDKDRDRDKGGSELPSKRLFRRSLYLKRCLDVFRSRIQYRLGKRTYLEGVTPLADLSPNEVGQLFMSAPPMEFRQQQQQQQQQQDELRQQQQYKAELRKQRKALKEDDLKLAPDDDGDDNDYDGGEDELERLARMARKLESGESFAKDASLVMDSKSAKILIAAMLANSSATGLTGESDEYRLAIREELIGAELEHKSEACAELDDQGHALPAYPTDRWPLSDQRPEGRVSGKLPDELAQQRYEAPQLGQWRRQHLDWSHHKCFHRVYKQFSNCGCCYVVAAVNLAEFVSCTEQVDSIAPRRFSEMHVLNCGLKYHPYNMGCSGGSVLETLRFIGLAGVYTRNVWRQRVEQEAKRRSQLGGVNSNDINCPMSLDMPWQEWGHDKVLLNPVVVHPNEWLEALEDGPLVATVQMPRDGIVTYLGAVHDGSSCEGSGIWHVMVLVGYGIDEHGIPYWRFRNSFGPEWGDRGHFNLAMSVAPECFAGGVRVYREPVQL